MQIVCGQCGTQMEAQPHPQTPSVTCTVCGHRISLVHFSQSSEAAEPDRKDLFEVRDDQGYADRARRFGRERLRVICGRCGARLLVPRRMSLQTINCQVCRREIVVPEPPEEEYDVSLEEDTAAEVKSLPVQAARRRHRNRRHKTWLWPTVGGLLAVAVVIVLLTLILAGASAPDDSNEPQQSVGNGPADRAAVDAQAVAPAPTTAGRPQVTTRAQAAAGGASRPLATIVQARWSVFAAGGYRPARPDAMFLKLAVAMRGGAKPSVFDNHGETVLLTVAGDIYRSLGEVVDEPPGPALARRGRIDLPAEETLQKQFLFELPAAAGQAVLAIQGFRSLRFTLPPRPDDDPQATGTFIETPPRNLKPLLTQPIMQAIQQAVDHRMLIKDQAGELIVSIPEARVRGRLRPKRNGLYEGTLRRDQATLPVWLRYVKSPSLVILYLSERPMYQLSYRLKDTPEPDFSDEVADPERPQFFGQ